MAMVGRLFRLLAALTEGLALLLCVLIVLSAIAVWASRQGVPSASHNLSNGIALGRTITNDAAVGIPGQAKYRTTCATVSSVSS